MENCLFCKIAQKEIPSRVVYEDDEVLVFHDVDPKAPVHVLLIPKVHISSMNDVGQDDIQVIAHLTSLIPRIASTLGVKDNGYRIVINCGSDGGQTVGHIHYHLLGGRELAWPPG
jgi:histidine triad (HIT) family protein